MGKKTPKIVIPSLIATSDFRPTSNQQRFAIIFFHEPDLSPGRVLKKLNLTTQCWYNWIRNPLFLPWLRRVADDFYSSGGLANVYRSIYENACSNSAQDRKLFLERFDKDYKPQTGTTVNFAGYQPPETNEAAIQASEDMRKSVESKESGNNPPELSTEVPDDQSE